MITLYHGSNVRVDCIDLSRCNPYKDFGRAFYMASDREQAQDVALARVDIFGGEPVVNEYRFDETLLADGALSYGQHRQKGVSPAAEYMRGITFQYAFCTQKAIEKLSPYECK